LLDSRDETVAGHVAEADAADAELAIDGAGSAAYLTASLDADALTGQHLDFIRGPTTGLQFFQLSCIFDVLCFGRHSLGHFLSSCGGRSKFVSFSVKVCPHTPAGHGSTLAANSQSMGAISARRNGLGITARAPRSRSFWS